MHPLLKSRTVDTIGYPIRDEVSEALGDMVMYLWSVLHALHEPFVELQPCLACSIDIHIADMAESFARLVRFPDRIGVQAALIAVADAARCCCIDLKEAAECSLRKCLSFAATRELGPIT